MFSLVVQTFFFEIQIHRRLPTVTMHLSWQGQRKLWVSLGISPRLCQAPGKPGAGLSLRLFIGCQITLPLPSSQDKAR